MIDVGTVPKRKKMPYKNRASIGLDAEVRDRLARHKDKRDESWQQFIVECLKARIELERKK